MDVIALVVSVAVVISNGNPVADTKTVNSYAIQGFQTMAACEKAKPAELARMKVIVGGGLTKREVVAECVSYSGK